MNNKILHVIDAVQTTIPLVDTINFPERGVVQIENEQIAYFYASDTNLLRCKRGYAGTTPASHIVANGLVTYLRDIDINPALVSLIDLTSPVAITIGDVNSDIISIKTSVTDILSLILPNPTHLTEARRLMVAHSLHGVSAYGTFTFSGLLANDSITIGTPAGFSILGVNDNNALLAGSTITNTNSSVVTGDLALSPGTSVTGFPPGTISGVQHINDLTAAQAQTDFTVAYNNLVARPVTHDYTGTDLGTLTLTPGVYKFTSSAQLTGTLILDAQGDPNANFVFQIGTTLTTATSSVVSLINSASAGNVFWAVGTSATIGISTTMKGNILALASITMNTSASLLGRALARTGAVTLDTNAVTTSPVVFAPVGNSQTFTAKVSPVGPNQFALGANDNEAAANAVIAINALIGGLVTATSLLNVITITAVQSGVAGNSIALSSSNGTRAVVVAMAHGSDLSGLLTVNTVSIPVGHAQEFVWDQHNWIIA